MIKGYLRHFDFVVFNRERLAIYVQVSFRCFIDAPGMVCFIFLMHALTLFAKPLFAFVVVLFAIIEHLRYGI